jgi:predicted metal-binding membrane protein
MAEWRKGLNGAFIMGVRHGIYCVSCCWALMALLFAFGVMNLPLVAALALSVALEKLAPGGAWIARAIGGILIITGIWILVAGTGTMTTM